MTPFLISRAIQLLAIPKTKPQWEADEANRRADADAHWEKGDLVKP